MRRSEAVARSPVAPSKTTTRFDADNPVDALFSGIRKIGHRRFEQRLYAVS